MTLLFWCSHVCAEDSKPPSGNFDLSHWKLTLPVSASDTSSGKSMEILPALLNADYANSEYFYCGTDGAMVFWCPVTGARTEHTDYPRCELRELIVPTDDNVCWSAKGSHTLDVRCRVMEVPSSQKVIIGQIHSYSGKAKPLIKLQFFKGRIEALVKERPTKGKDFKLTFPEVGLGNAFDYQIMLENGMLSVTINGSSQSVNIFETDPEWADQTLYFKAGCYVQDNEGPTTEGGRVSITKLEVRHSDDLSSAASVQ